MDWLASAAAWLREWLGEFALLGALKPTIDGLPDWVLLAACVSIVATLVLAVFVLAAQMRSPPKRSEARPFAGAQDAVGAQKKGAAKPVGTSSKPARWTVSMEAKLRNAAPLDFDKVVALAQDAEFAAEGVTVRGIAVKAQSMGLGDVARHAPDAPDPVIVPEAESIVSPGPAIDQQRMPQTMNEDELHTFIRAAFSASYMIAAADGEISSEEMQAFMDSLKQRLDVDMDPAELVESFEAALELEAEQHLERIAEAAVLSADLRRDILDIALSIAASDGDFDPSEIQCLPIVAAALDVDLSGDEEEESEDSDADPDDGGEDINPVASLPSNAGKGLPDLDPDQNPIIAATLDGNVDKLKRLLAEGHSANDIHTSGTNALILAVREGHLEIVDLLLGSGADPTRMNPKSGMTPIWMAVQELRPQIAGLLLERGADPDTPRHLPEANIVLVPLAGLQLLASKYDDARAFEMIDMFLRSGADPKSKGPGLCFPLLALAVQKHRPQTLDLLLRAGVDPNVTDEKTGLRVLPVLIGAANSEKDGKALQMLDLLLNAGLRNQHIQMEEASISAVQFCAMQDDLPPGFLSRIAAGATKADVDLALWAACLEGSAANVRELLGAGANVNMAVPWLDHDPTTVGDSPLNAAATRGHTECARLLIDAGADVNRNSPPEGGQFPLLMAAENGHQKIVSMLLSAGADVSMINPENGTHALGGAVRNGHSGIVKMLLDAGADPNIRSRGYSSPMIMLAAYAGDLAIIQSLISHGADVNQPNPQNGSTALMAAANRGHSDVVEFLLRHGADASLISTVTGADALLAAVSGGHPESVRLLLNAGADVHRAYSGTPLTSIAAEKGEADLVRLLIAHGAKVDAVDSDGLTALQRAGINRHGETEATLIELGADPDTRLVRLSDTAFGQEIQEKLLRDAQQKGAEIAKLLMLDGFEENEELKELDRSSADRNFLEKARADALDEARRLGAEGAENEVLAEAASDFVEKATSALDVSEEEVESVGQDGVDQRDAVHGVGTDPRREATTPSADLIGGDGLRRPASMSIPEEELSGLIKSIERLPAVISFLKQDTTIGDEWNTVVRRRHDKLVGMYVEKTWRLSAADWKRFSPHYARALTLSANIRVVENDYAGASGLLQQAVSIFSDMMASGDEGLITKHRPYFEHAERSAKVLEGARQLMDVVSGNSPFDREREGFSAYKAGDFATAIENYRAAAEAGLINSQYNLGEMYSLGEGVEKNWPEAERLWKLAAEGGHARASFNLAVAYANGEGNLPENLDEAMRFAKLAAEQGYPRAAGIVARLERRAREDATSVEPEGDSPSKLQFMVPFLSALWLIMAADGEVVDEEVTMFTRIMNGVVSSLGIDNFSEHWISEALSALADHDDEAHFSSIAESPFVQTLGYRTELVKAMFFLMAADGNSAPEETEVFDRICASFAVTGDVYQITDELSIRCTEGGITLH